MYTLIQENAHHTKRSKTLPHSYTAPFDWRVRVRSLKGACFYRINKDPLRALVWSHKRSSVPDRLAFGAQWPRAITLPGRSSGRRHKGTPGPVKNTADLTSLLAGDIFFSQFFGANSLDFVHVRVLKTGGYFFSGGEGVIIKRNEIKQVKQSGGKSENVMTTTYSFCDTNIFFLCFFFSGLVCLHALKHIAMQRCNRPLSQGTLFKKGRKRILHLTSEKCQAKVPDRKGEANEWNKALEDNGEALRGVYEIFLLFREDTYSSFSTAVSSWRSVVCGNSAVYSASLVVSI